MTKNKPSAPLPWKLDQEFHNLWRIIDDDGNVIFIGRPDVAALLFAAPDMREALEDLMWRFEEDEDDVSSDFAPDVHAARAAIAKAKETP